MGELRKWSPGNLYDEVRSSPAEVYFRYPSRRIGSYLLFGSGLCLAVWGFLMRLPGSSLLRDLPWMIVAGGLTLLLAAAMVFSILDQRILRIRPSTNHLTYRRRTPLRDEQVTLRFASLKALQIEPTASPSSESPPRFDLLLLTASGSRIFLGTDSLVTATTLGRRLSDLLRIPRHSPQA